MRAIAGLIVIFFLLFGLPWLFFGRASWFGSDTRSIPVWVSLGFFTLGLLTAGVAVRFGVSWTLPLRY